MKRIIVNIERLFFVAHYLRTLRLNMLDFEPFWNG